MELEVELDEHTTKIVKERAAAHGYAVPEELLYMLKPELGTLQPHHIERRARAVTASSANAAADPDTADLWDWRRRIADLYAAVRAAADPESAWRLWRDTRADLFANHAQTPLDEGAAQPSYFDYDPTLRLAVHLIPASGVPFHLPAGADGDVEVTPFARTRGLGERLGAELAIYWIGGYGGGAFLPFLDATSGNQSYGGGRYLVDSIKGADLGIDGDGRTVLDFNFAYNPSCFYSARWTCPLAPHANRLPAAVRAGETAGGRP
jgi:hypothetical protein